MKNLKPIRTEADYQAALVVIERLWGARAGTPQGDRLDLQLHTMSTKRGHTNQLDKCAYFEPTTAVYVRI